MKLNCDMGLEIDAHKNILTKALLDDIRSNKVEIICFLKGLNGRNSAEIRYILITEEKESYPLSHAQMRLWIVNQIEEDNVAYNIPGAFILKGDLCEKSFSKAFRYVTQRHESLRTIFSEEEGKPMQKVLKCPNNDIEIIDLRNVENSEKRANKIAEKEILTPFNLKKGPLIRLTLVRLEEKKYIILFNMHHIISDGWSMGILAKEFFSA